MTAIRILAVAVAIPVAVLYWPVARRALRRRRGEQAARTRQPSARPDYRKAAREALSWTDRDEECYRIVCALVRGADEEWERLMRAVEDGETP